MSSGDNVRKGPPPIDGMFTLKIDNISFRTTVEDLKEKFGTFGQVGDVYIPRNHQRNNEPKGYAFVRFLDKRDAEDAQRGLDGTDLDGRCIAIQEAKQKRPDYPKDNYRNNNNSSRYGRDRRDYSRDRRDSSRDRRDYGRDRRDSYRDERSPVRRNSRRSRSYSRSRSPLPAKSADHSSRSRRRSNSSNDRDRSRSRSGGRR